LPYENAGLTYHMNKCVDTIVCITSRQPHHLPPVNPGLQKQAPVDTSHPLPWTPQSQLLEQLAPHVPMVH